MPSPWLALLKNVPWIDVIRNAATVADGARKLWNSVRKPQPSQPPQAAEEQLLLPDPQGMARLQARLAASERAMAELQEEMVASSELINSLAEQNAQLVARVVAMRRRMLWLAVSTAVFGVTAAVALVLGLAS